jgi:hypothetical protein
MPSVLGKFRHNMQKHHREDYYLIVYSVKHALIISPWLRSRFSNILQPLPSRSIKAVAPRYSWPIHSKWAFSILGVHLGSNWWEGLMVVLKSFVISLIAHTIESYWILSACGIPYMRKESNTWTAWSIYISKKAKDVVPRSILTARGYLPLTQRYSTDNGPITYLRWRCLSCVHIRKNRVTRISMGHVSLCWCFNPWRAESVTNRKLVRSLWNYEMLSSKPFDLASLVQ